MTGRPLWPAPPNWLNCQSGFLFLTCRVWVLQWLMATPRMRNKIWKHWKHGLPCLSRRKPADRFSSGRWLAVVAALVWHGLATYRSTCRSSQRLWLTRRDWHGALKGPDTQCKKRLRAASRIRFPNFGSSHQNHSGAGGRGVHRPLSVPNATTGTLPLA